MTQFSQFPSPAISRRDQARMRWLMLAMMPMLLASFAPRAAWAERPVDAKPEKADKKEKADGKHDPLDTEPAQWTRFVEDGKGGGKLQVAIGTYKNDKDVTVHLVGAVHVGEKQYYEGLNKEFAKYDALLYEMVKPADAGAPRKGQPSKSMVSMFQRFLKDMLELDFQLDDIDYSKANFVHADLDAETFEKLQEERGESIMGLMLQQMIREMMKNMDGKNEQPQAQPNLLELVDAFNSPDRARQFKMILGKTFGDLEDQMSGMQGTVLVTERNKKAMSVLKDEIRGGKKNIGVFYGAAHLGDMENTMFRMGFKRTGLEWRTAWDMTAGGADAKPDEKAGEKKE